LVHLNHTNPLLDAGSEESRLVRSQGYHIAAADIRLGL